MRPVAAPLAMLVMALSVLGGLVILRSDVSAARADPDRSPASAFQSARGQVTYGGEQRYPDDWLDQCRDAGRQHLRYLALPGATGAASLGALVVAVRANRRRPSASSSP